MSKVFDFKRIVVVIAEPEKFALNAFCTHDFHFNKQELLELQYTLIKTLKA